jgi:hypothetical protein
VGCRGTVAAHANDNFTKIVYLSNGYLFFYDKYVRKPNRGLKNRAVSLLMLESE